MSRKFVEVTTGEKKEVVCIILTNLSTYYSFTTPGIATRYGAESLTFKGVRYHGNGASPRRESYVSLNCDYEVIEL